MKLTRIINIFALVILLFSVMSEYQTFAAESISNSDVYRIPERPSPYNNDSYYVKGNTIYHRIPNWPGGAKTINLGIKPPSFIKEGYIYVKDASDRFYRRTGSGDQYRGVFALSVSKSSIYRIPERPAPYNNDSYFVKNNILFHKVPNWPSGAVTINLGIKPPSFIKEGYIYVKDASDRFYRRTGSGDQYRGIYSPPTKRPEVFRIPQRPAPYNNDTYYVKNNTLYHSVPNWPGGGAVLNLRVSPPAFLKEGYTYVRDESDKFYRRTGSGDHYRGTYIPPYKALDLRKPSKISATQIDSFIRSIVPASPLVGHGQDYINAQAKFGVNAQYLVAHSLLESNWGRSDLARLKHNLFGYGAADSDPFNLAFYFPSLSKSIEYEAYIVRKNYLNADGKYYNGSNLKGMNVRYASDKDWGEKISSIMERLRTYNSSEYNVAVLSGYSGELKTPGRIIPTTYINGIMGKVINVTSAVNFRSQPSTSSSIIGTLPLGSKFEVIERDTYNWYKIKAGGKIGWVFGDYVEVTNLLEVVDITTTLTVRQQPSVTSTKITSVSNGTKLQAILDPQGNIITSIKPDGTWYNIKTKDGKVGWVFGKYINRLKN